MLHGNPQSSWIARVFLRGVHACVRACVHVCMCACVHACMRACVHAGLHVCRYVYQYLCSYVRRNVWRFQVCVHMFV